MPTLGPCWRKIKLSLSLSLPGGRTTCKINLDRTPLTSYDTRRSGGSVRERGIQIRNSRIGLPGCPEFSVMNQSINQSIHQQQVAFSIFKNPQAFISVALVPSFHFIGPPHPWIFHPIRGLSTSNRIEEYVQRSMDGDYPRVACNSSHM